MSNEAGALRELAWAQVDVFAERALEGNMLAVFPDATGLSDAQMQALARETNLSETTFVFPRELEVEHSEGVRVRIFTTLEELPFAGHPTLGTASWLKMHHPNWRDAETVTLALNAGRVPVRFIHEEGSTGAPGIVAEMTQPEPVFGAEVDVADLAGALGVNAADMHGELSPQVVSTGLPFLIAPLATVQVLRGLSVDYGKLHTLLAGSGAKFLYCLAKHDDRTWEARMPFYGAEDPATGSAAGCAISYLVHRGAVGADEPVDILQGAMVNRPSRIFARASFGDGRVKNVRIAGRTISVASGRFLLQ